MNLVLSCCGCCCCVCCSCVTLSGGPFKYSLRTVGSYLFGSCRTAFLMGAGDLLAQRYYNDVRDLENVNWMRTIKYATIGLCFMGPALTYWTRMMQPWVQQTRTSTAIKQILSDQIYLAPSINLGLIIMSDIVHFKSREDIEQSVRDKYVFLLKQHYAFWPAVQTFCTFFIQPNLQLLFANTIAIGWFAFLSNIFNKFDKVGQKKEEVAYQKSRKRFIFL